MNSPQPRNGRIAGPQLPSTASGPLQDPGFYLPRVEPSRYLGILRRRAWIVILCSVILAVGTYVVLSLVPKVYVATGSLYVSTQAPRVAAVKPVAPEESADLEQMYSVEQGMLSSNVLLRVIARHDLRNDRTFSKKPLTEQRALKLLSKRVRIELRRGTRVIDIAVEDTDPRRAAALVESIKEEYEAAAVERQEETTDRLSRGLAREEQRLKERMEASARRLQEFREANLVPGLEGTGQGGVVRDELGELTTQLSQAKASRMRLEAEVEAFRGFDVTDPDALAGVGRSEHTAEVLALLRILRDKEVEFARVKERYLHKHPVYKEVSHEIENLKHSVEAAVVSAGEALEKSYKVAVDNEAKLEVEMAAARARAVGDDGVRADYATLAREAETDRELYLSVARSLRETALATSAQASVLSWQGRPLAPDKPAYPRKALLAPVGGVGGFMLGLLLVAGLELSDRRVRDSAMASKLTGTPLLARVPAEAGADGMLVISNPCSAGAEAFRRLRAVLIPPVPDGNLRTVLFTSARDGEGKSFCAMNHAVSLAIQGYRTLLLDADMRSPGLSARHIEEAGLGLGDFLAGEVGPGDACFRTAVPKLYLLSSGEMRGDAAELLSGTRFPVLIENAYRWFDRVVIDAPAVLDNSDAQAIARYADRTCLVVGASGSERGELSQAAGLLRAGGANLAGFLWNEVPSSGKRPTSVAVARGTLGAAAASRPASAGADAGIALPIGESE